MGVAVFPTLWHPLQQFARSEGPGSVRVRCKEERGGSHSPAFPETVGMTRGLNDVRRGREEAGSRGRKGKEGSRPREHVEHMNERKQSPHGPSRSWFLQAHNRQVSQLMPLCTSSVIGTLKRTYSGGIIRGTGKLGAYLALRRLRVGPWTTAPT